MSTTNIVYAVYKGTDPAKMCRIEEFEPHLGDKTCRLVARGFRNAGKISEFLNTHGIASCERRYNFNGYGYADRDYLYLLSPANAKDFEGLLKAKKKQKKPSEEDTITAWAKRLAKLTGIPVEEAEKIAEEKRDYKQHQIDELELRQTERFSERRQRKINALQRSNPLRRIKDEDHARNTLAASVRHRYSDYEAQLAEAKEMAAWNIIRRDSVREYARAHTTYSATVDSVYPPKQ